MFKHHLTIEINQPPGKPQPLLPEQVDMIMATLNQLNKDFTQNHGKNWYEKKLFIQQQYDERISTTSRNLLLIFSGSLSVSAFAISIPYTSLKSAFELIQRGGDPTWNDIMHAFTSFNISFIALGSFVTLSNLISTISFSTAYNFKFLKNLLKDEESVGATGATKNAIVSMLEKAFFLVVCIGGTISAFPNGANTNDGFRDWISPENYKEFPLFVGSVIIAFAILIPGFANGLGIRLLIKEELRLLTYPVRQTLFFNQRFYKEKDSERKRQRLLVALDGIKIRVDYMPSDHRKIFCQIFAALYQKIKDSIQPRKIKGTSIDDISHKNERSQEKQSERNRQGIFSSADKYASNIQQELQKILANTDYHLEKAYGGGDCFYDACANALNGIKKTTEHSIKSLRELCSNYAQVLERQYPVATVNASQVDRETNWIFQALRCDIALYQKYLIQAVFTAEETKSLRDNYNIGDGYAVWGEQDIDAKIICAEYQVKLHVIEIREEALINPKENLPLFMHLLIDDNKTYSLESASHELFSNPNIMHLVTYRNHYVPLLKQPLQHSLDKHYSSEMVDTHKVTLCPEINAQLYNNRDISTDEIYQFYTLLGYKLPLAKIITKQSLVYLISGIGAYLGNLYVKDLIARFCGEIYENEPVANTIGIVGVCFADLLWFLLFNKCIKSSFNADFSWKKIGLYAIFSASAVCPGIANLILSADDSQLSDKLKVISSIFNTTGCTFLALQGYKGVVDHFLKMKSPEAVLEEIINHLKEYISNLPEGGLNEIYNKALPIINGNTITQKKLLHSMLQHTLNTSQNTETQTPTLV